MAQSAGTADIKAVKMSGSIRLILGIPVGLGTGAFQGLGGDVYAGRSGCGGGGRLFAPFVDEENNQGGADDEIKHRHEPSDQTESVGRRLGVHRGPEFLNQGFGNFAFGIALGDHASEFLEHGSGHGAAHVIALREDLGAAAHAEEFAADLFYAVGLLLGEKGKDGEEGDCEKGG